jgi:hypothetical protein
MQILFTFFLGDKINGRRVTSAERNVVVVIFCNSRTVNKIERLIETDLLVLGVSLVRECNCLE